MPGKHQRKKKMVKRDKFTVIRWMTSGNLMYSMVIVLIMLYYILENCWESRLYVVITKNEMVILQWLALLGCNYFTMYVSD